MFHTKETSVTFPAALRRLWDHIRFITGHQWASRQRVWWWFRARNIPKTRLWKLLHKTLATEIPRENTDITYNAVEKSPTVTVLYLLRRYPEQNERQPQTHAGLFDGINKPSLRVSDETRPDSCPCHGNKQLGWPSLILHTASTHRGNCQYMAFRQPCNVLQKGGLLWCRQEEREPGMKCTGLQQAPNPRRPTLCTDARLEWGIRIIQALHFHQTVWVCQWHVKGQRWQESSRGNWCQNEHEERLWPILKAIVFSFIFHAGSEIKRLMPLLCLHSKYESAGSSANVRV